MDQQEWAVRAGDSILRGDVPWLTSAFLITVLAMAVLLFFLKREEKR
jgi:hypothetical protein